MRPAATEMQPLLDSREALTLYLDSLFRDAISTDAHDEAATGGSGLCPRTAPALVASHAEPVVNALPAAVESAPRVVLKGITTCAVLRAGDLRLALPLADLHGIRLLNERLCRLPHLPQWMLGISAGARSQVVDTTALLGAGQAGVYAAMHVVTIAPERWALACDRVEGTIKVKPEEVRWRPHRDAEPWFAGIIAGELCPLIDVATLVEWLDVRAAW